MSDAPKKIRNVGGVHRQNGDNEITIGGLTEPERSQLEGWILGTCWARVSEERRLETLPRFKELPSPIDDPLVSEYWPPPPAGDFTYQKLIPHDRDKLSEHNSPSFSIQHLCGYGYTPDNYKREAAKLESYGFECLRSRRGTDGTFIEIWYLSGMWRAKGELLKALEAAGFTGFSKSGKKAADTAASFLCRNASFGTLDVSVQRAAMVID